MNCSKCSAELKPDAKFCPNCGTPVQAQNQKPVCSSCGLELLPSAKFCSVCGTPAASAAPSPTPAFSTTAAAAPSALDPTPAAPANSSDNLVAAMQAAAQEALRQEADTVTSAPAGMSVSLDKSPFPAPSDPFAAPVSQIPAPVNSAPAQTDAAPSQQPFSAPSDIFGAQGYSSPGSGMTPPPFTNDGFAPSAAAVAVAPAKKKHTAGIIIGAAAALLIVAAAVIFLLFRGPVMNLFMGDSGYAAMIEGNSLGNAARTLSNPAVSESINAAAAAGVQMSALSADRTANDINDNFNDELFGQTGYSMDFGAVISTVRNYLSAGYGTDGVTFTGSANVTLTDAAKALISSDAETIAEIEKAIETINSTNVTYSLNASDSAAALTVGMNDGSMDINARGLILTDGTAYLIFPFSGGKALKMTVEQGGTSVSEVKPLSIDPAEISRLAGEITDIYLECYKSSAITIDSGEITAYGMTADGRLITAEIDSAALSKLFSDISDHIANDEYLCTQITEFAAANGLDFTADDFRSSVANYFNNVSFDANDRLVIKTVVDNSNNILARSFIAYDGAESAYISCVYGKEKTAVEAGENEKAFITADITYTAENSGSIDFTFSDNGNAYSFRLAFENASTAQFCGRDVYVGKYTLTFTPPADFTADAGEYQQVLTALCSSALTMESSVENGDYKFSVGLDVPQYGSLRINTGISPNGADGALEVPADAIDVSTVIYSTGTFSDEDISRINEICALISDMRNTIAASDSSAMATALCDQLDKLAADLQRAAQPMTDSTEVFDFLSEISTRQYDIREISYKYPYVPDAGLEERVDSLSDEYSDLYDSIYSELTDNGYELPLSSFTEYKSRYDELNAKADALIAEYIAADEERRTNIDYSDLTFDEITETLIELESRYYEIISFCSDQIDSDESLSALFSDTTDAYSEAVDDYFDVNDGYSSGRIDASKMRKLRRSAEAFAKSLGELEAAVQNGQL